MRLRRPTFRFVTALAAALTLLDAIGAQAQTVPAQPPPAAVTLPASSTAVLVVDLAASPCNAAPRCVALVPRVAALLAAARRAGVYVAFSSAMRSGIDAPTTQQPFLTGIAPANGDLVVTGGAQDRFFGTLLDQNLRRHGITTVVLAGWKIDGSILYTAVGANLRAYTVVVADDATSATDDVDVAIGRYMLLTQLNANPRNEPLHRGAVTLSRTDLITFR